MAASKKRRQFERVEANTQILYSDSPEGENFQAHMSNCSIDGLYLESTKALIPGSQIVIKFENYSKDRSVPKTYDGFCGEVIWCQTLRESHNYRYGAGIQYTDNL